VALQFVMIGEPLMAGLFNRFGPHFNSQMAPTPAGRPHVETARPIEHNLIRIPAIHQIFKKGIDQYREIGHQKHACPLRGVPSQQIAREVKKGFLPRPVPGMTPLGFNDLCYQLEFRCLQGAVEKSPEFGGIFDGSEFIVTQGQSFFTYLY